MKIIFITVLPSPYQRELFRAMKNSGNIEPEVLYYASSLTGNLWVPPDLDGNETVLKGFAPTVAGATAYVHPEIWRRLSKSRADLTVVADYSAPTAQLAMAFLRSNKKPWVFWGEIPGFADRGRIGRWLRHRLQRPLATANAIAAIGTNAAEAYKARFENQRIFNIPYFCDLVPYQTACRASRKMEQTSDVKILFSGQMIDRKGVNVLIDAFIIAVEHVPQLRLILLGDGPERQRFEAQIPTHLANRVSFLGHKAPNDLPGVFASADLFCLPSMHDGWGLVINEALGAGLPIVASASVGAARDLVEEGINGFIVPAGDRKALAAVFIRLGSNAYMRESFATASSRASLNWGLEEGVRRWHAAAEAILKAEISRHS